MNKEQRVDQIEWRDIEHWHERAIKAEAALNALTARLAAADNTALAAIRKALNAVHAADDGTCFYALDAYGVREPALAALDAIEARLAVEAERDRLTEECERGLELQVRERIKMHAERQRAEAAEVLVSRYREALLDLQRRARRLIEECGRDMTHPVEGFVDDVAVCVEDFDREALAARTDPPEENEQR